MTILCARRERRHAFTLIELLIAMGIILLLAALGLMFLPRINANMNVSSAAQKVQGMLMIAKQRAKRDQLPTGVRIVFDQNQTVSGQTHNIATQLQYIQQPEDFTTAVVQDSTGQNVVVQYDSQQNGNSYTPGFTPAGFPFSQVAQPGEYFVVTSEPSGPFPRQIDLAAPLTLVQPQPCATCAGGVDTRPLPSPLTSPFRIIRAPRLLAGEPALQLPTDAVVDLNSSVNLPPSRAPASNPTCDILFMPSGPVILASTAPLSNCTTVGGSSATGGGPSLICVYIRDFRDDGTGAATAPPSLIAIQAQSGLIGAFPVAAGTNYWQYAQDPHSSGM